MPTIQTSQGRIAYERRGAGPAVVLLHGNAHDRHDYDAVVPALAREFTVFAVDWPGCGESPAPATPGESTAAGLAALLPEIVERLGASPAILVGNSVGGYAAVRLALTHPPLVRALVLVDSGGFTAHNPVSRLFCRVKGTELVSRLVAERFPRFYLRRRTPTVEAMLARSRAHGRDRVGIAIDAAIWRSFTAPEHDLRTQAAGIRVPTLLVWGRHDPVLPLRDAEAARRALPHARFVVFDTGHVPFAEDPDGFLGAVLPFVRDAAAQDAGAMRTATEREVS
jgi:pimeloyl-ACP methyl ester carboxylesterase